MTGDIKNNKSINFIRERIFRNYIIQYYFRKLINLFQKSKQY